MKLPAWDKIFFWRERKKTSRKVLAASVLISLAIGAIGLLFTEVSVRSWFPTLIQSSLTPPGYVFVAVWTVLYILLGISFWLVWEKSKLTHFFALSAFGFQFACNLFWPILFFYLQSPSAALVDIVFLLIAIGVTIETFRKISRNAALVLVPYFLWVCFAGYLNLYIVLHN